MGLTTVALQLRVRNADNPRLVGTRWGRTRKDQSSVITLVPSSFVHPTPTPPPLLLTSDGVRHAKRGGEGAVARRDWLRDTFGLHPQDSAASTTAAAALFLFFFLIPIS